MYAVNLALESSISRISSIYIYIILDIEGLLETGQPPHTEHPPTRSTRRDNPFVRPSPPTPHWKVSVDSRACRSFPHPTRHIPAGVGYASGELYCCPGAAGVPLFFAREPAGCGVCENIVAIILLWARALWYNASESSAPTHSAREAWSAPH